MAKPLPKDLTSYDLLKAVAIILTVIDHVGYFFYPDDMWFRTLGRLCLPIWFFLIGFAHTTKVPKSFWIGGSVLVASAMVAGEYLLPLNILFTMAFLRIYRAGVVRHSLHSPEALRGMFLILFFLSFPSAILVEYGAIAMSIVLVGYIVRHKEDIYRRIEKKYVIIYVASSFAAFYLILGINMPSIDANQALFMLGGFAILAFILWRFEPVIYVDADKFMAPSFISLFKFLGRRTLEIYIAHLLMFRAIAMYYDPERFGFMEWEISQSGLMALFS